MVAPQWPFKFFGTTLVFGEVVLGALARAVDIWCAVAKLNSQAPSRHRSRGTEHDSENRGYQSLPTLFAMSRIPRLVFVLFCKPVNQRTASRWEFLQEIMPDKFWREMGRKRGLMETQNKCFLTWVGQHPGRFHCGGSVLIAELPDRLAVVQTVNTMRRAEALRPQVQQGFSQNVQRRCAVSRHSFTIHCHDVSDSCYRKPEVKWQVHNSYLLTKHFLEQKKPNCVIIFCLQRQEAKPPLFHVKLCDYFRHTINRPWFYFQNQATGERKTSSYQRAFTYFSNVMTSTSTSVDSEMNSHGHQEATMVQQWFIAFQCDLSTFGAQFSKLQHTTTLWPCFLQSTFHGFQVSPCQLSVDENKVNILWCAVVNCQPGMRLHVRHKFHGFRLFSFFRIQNNWIPLYAVEYFREGVPTKNNFRSQTEALKPKVVRFSRFLQKKVKFPQEVNLQAARDDLFLRSDHSNCCVILVCKTKHLLFVENTNFYW